MVAVEEKKKLLKMKERFLEVAFNSQNDDNNVRAILDEYKEIAIEVDKSLFDELISKVSNSEYEELPLEEKIVFLDEVEKIYDNLDEFQQKCNSLYSKYTNEELELSSLDNILIDNIRKMNESIKKYLEDKAKIENNEQALNELNMELILEDKKDNVFKDRLNRLETELKDNFVKVEGRIYNSAGEVEYTNILKEYANVGIDLKRVLSDDALLKEELDKVMAVTNDLKQKKEVAEICYNSKPDHDYKEIYDGIKTESMKADYRVVLLRICELVRKDANNYDDALNKRSNILSLMKERSNILRDLGIRYLYDPFDRLNVGDQLEFVNSFDKNILKIKDIRKKMEEINTQNDEMNKEIQDCLEAINSNLPIYEDTETLENIIDSSDIVARREKVFTYNQVVTVNNMPDGILLDRVHNKTNGVINRVYEMVNGSKKDEKMDTIPELVIDSSGFNEVKPVEEIVPEIVPEVFIEKAPEVVPDTNIFIENNSDIFGNNVQETVPQEVIEEAPIEPTPVVNKEEVTFQNVEPFASTELFGDRYDDGTAQVSDERLSNLKIETLPENNKKSLNLFDKKEETSLEMPDVNDFWVTKDNSDNESEKENQEQVLSFDEQIASLIDDKAKTKKLA